MRVSVIIPTLNEASTISDCLKFIGRQRADDVVVVDGSSKDGTAEIAASAGARVLATVPGRGHQQNEGAAAVTGDALLFLHADCRLDDGAIDVLRSRLDRNPRIPGGCFRMRVQAPDRLYRWIDAAAHLRAGVIGLPYGDQGLFVARWAFEKVGGFPRTRLMEDVLMALALRRLGRLILLPSTIHVSPRRWQRQGIARQTARNWALTACAAVGVSPDQLADYYPTVR